ncbi:MAG: polysaccharide biosynthesis C-terminal domain-containing protein, partial [Bacteroidota bacterium]
GGLLTIPVYLQSEAQHSFYWVALAVPFVMLQGAFRAVPMAVQRFDLFNLMLGLGGVFQWAGSLLLVLIGKGLLEIALLTLAIRVLGALAAYWIAKSLFPDLSFKRIRRVRETVKKLVSFGGWLTVSQLVSPVTRYLDRVFVVSYQSLKMFTYYAVPYEAITKLGVIPLSLSSALFPAMSERDGTSRSSVHVLYIRTLNLMVLIMLPMSLVLALFSREILQFWLGGEFPAMSGTVFSILAIAAFVQAVGFVPVTALQAVGRPDIATKFYLAEIPLYVLLCLLLIPSYGIEGAAWAWLIRLAIIVPAILFAAHNVLKGGMTESRSIVRVIILNAFLSAGLLLVSIKPLAFGTLAGVIAVSMVFYVFVSWFYCLDEKDRSVIKRSFARHL